MVLDFILSQSDGRPMYLQIMEQVKQRITGGDWQAGSALPSIREMAVAAKVSVITVKRAYQELEAQGVIVTQAGKGSFVAPNQNLSVQLQEQAMDEHLNQALAMAKQMGLSPADVIERIKEVVMQSANQQDTNNE